MPILARRISSTAAAPDGSTAPGVGNPTTAEPTIINWGGARARGPRISLTATDGTVFDLGDPSALLATLGRKGFDAPNYDPRTVETPLVDGEIFRGARALPRDMVLPIYLRANTRVEFLTAKRLLLSKLAARNGLLTLAVAEPDGTRRTLGCYFSGRGAEGDMSRDQQGLLWVKYNLELRAPTPFWEGEETSLTFSGGSSDTFFPFLPLKVKTGTSFGEVQINNPGDVPAWPMWQVEGPCTGFTLQSNQGTQFTFNQTVLAGESIIINAHPHQLLVVNNDGQNRWAGVGEGSVMWSVPPGDSTISVSANGSATNTKISLSFRPRYETA